MTGGAGFIGSHLCDRLVRNQNVLCIDNFTSGSHENIAHLLTNRNFEFIRHELTTPLSLEDFPELERFNISTFGIQEIYNLACPTSVKQFDQFKIQTIEANSLVVKYLLDVTVLYKAKFLQASSSVIYGARREGTPSFQEEMLGIVSTTNPRACYDEGKRFSETITSTYRQVHDLDTKIARIFRTYGPRMKLFDGQMIPDFILNALEGKDLVIYGDETFTTSLVFVDDVVDGLLAFMESPEAGPLNLGSSEDYLLVDVAKKIIEITASRARIVFDSPLLFMTSLGIPDIRLAKERLNWMPVTRLEEGLSKTIDYVQANKALIKKRYGK